MVFSNGVTSTGNGRPVWQCGYSGCRAVRATKLNGQLHRFCNDHRHRQNQHQRDSVERQRRGERRRECRRRVRVEPTGDVWALLDLEALFDSTRNEEVSTDAMIADWYSLLVESHDTVEPLEELALFPIESVDDILDCITHASYM